MDPFLSLYCFCVLIFVSVMLALDLICIGALGLIDE